MQASPTPEFFGEVAVLVVVGALIAYACHRIGLLPIVGFLVTGVVIGPNAGGDGPRARGCRRRVLASLTVGDATLRRYGAVSYTKNDACDLRNVPIMA